jgi:hypothetical protein
MFTQFMKLEVKGANDRIYRFECDPSSPLGEINDVLFTMKGVVMKQLQEQYEKESAKLPEAPEGEKEEAPKECCDEQQCCNE